MKLLTKTILGALAVSLLATGCSNSDKLEFKKQRAESSVALIKEAADRGESFALSQMGALYWYGHTVKQDKEKAVEYFNRAAEKGDAAAMFNLGVAYESGKGVKSNKLKAYDWWMKAVASGSENAAYNLDLLCKNSAWACKK